MSANISIEQALEVGEALNVDWGEVNLEEFRKGLEVEQEHAVLVEGDFIAIGQIALDHLKEIPDYYTRLITMEKEANMKESFRLKVGQKLLTEDGYEIEVEEGDYLQESEDKEDIEEEEDETLEERVLQDLKVKVKDLVLKKGQKVSAWGKDLLMDVLKIDVDSDSEVETLVLFPDENDNYSRIRKGSELIVSGSVNDKSMRPVKISYA